MSTKYTPGPWNVYFNNDGQPYAIGDTKENPILKIRGGMLPTHHDARLIAAAPELLQELKGLLNAITNYNPEAPMSQFKFDDIGVNALRDRAYAAIKKAEGK